MNPSCPEIQEHPILALHEENKSGRLLLSLELEIDEKVENTSEFFISQRKDLQKESVPLCILPKRFDAQIVIFFTNMGKWIPQLVQAHKLHLYFEFAAFAFSMRTVLNFYWFCFEHKIWAQSFKSNSVDFAIIYSLVQSAFKSYEKEGKPPHPNVILLDGIFIEVVSFWINECIAQQASAAWMLKIVNLSENDTMLRMLRNRVVYFLHYKTFERLAQPANELALIPMFQISDEMALQNIESILPCGLKWEMFKGITNWILAGGSVLRALSLMPASKHSDLDVFFLGKMEDQLKQLALFLKVICSSASLSNRSVYVLFIEEGSCRVFVEDWNFYFDLKLSRDERTEFGILHEFDSSLHRVAFHPAHGFFGTSDFMLASTEKRVHHPYFDPVAKQEALIKYKFATRISVCQPQLYRLESLFRAKFELHPDALAYLNSNKELAVRHFEDREQLKQVRPVSQFSQRVNLQMLRLMYQDYLNRFDPQRFQVTASMLSLDSLVETVQRMKQPKPKPVPVYKPTYHNES